jgi:hypothetical protein
MIVQVHIIWALDKPAQGSSEPVAPRIYLFYW